MASAPGHALAFRDGWVCVAEGQGRLRVFDLGDGTQLADVGLRGDGLPHQVVLLAGGRVALLGPVGVDTTLILAGSGEEVRIPLPGPARWCVPFGDGALVALRDGRCIAYPGLRETDLPAALATGEAPAVTAKGLASGGRLWPWIF
ncbi:MAG: hypothetical protein H0W72_16365 [Planctomycetes bacterium]|nr:hypothetical protein [Planctomycetota bacterium]